MKTLYEIQEKKPSENTSGIWKINRDYDDCTLEEAQACVKALRFKFQGGVEFRVVKVTRELTEI